MQSSFSATTDYSQTIVLPHEISKNYRYLMFWNDKCLESDIETFRELSAKEFTMYIVFGITALGKDPYPAKVRGIILVPSGPTLPYIVEYMPCNTTLFPFSISSSADVALDCITSMNLVYSGGAYHEDSIAISLLHALNVEDRDKENTKEIQPSIFEEETDVESSGYDTTDVEQ